MSKSIPTHLLTEENKHLITDELKLQHINFLIHKLPHSIDCCSADLEERSSVVCDCGKGMIEWLSNPIQGAGYKQEGRS